MPTDPVSETNFAWEGFLPVWLVALIGLVLIATAWWMARRDGRVAHRPKISWLLCGLRVVAVLVLLWMLAGPTLVTSTHQYRTRSVAILVDTSASMGLVDGVDGSGNVSRWAAAHGSSGVGKTLPELDSALGRLRAAQGQLTHVSQLPDALDDATEARQRLSDAVDGIDRGLAAVASAKKDLGDQASLFDEPMRSIQEQVLPVLREKSAAFNRGKTMAALDRRKWLPDQITVLTVALGQMEGAADRVAKAQEESPASSLAAEEDTHRTRLEKVENFLAEAEKTWLQEIRRQASVSRYEFGDKVVALGGSTWEKASQRKPLDGSTHLGAALQQVAMDNSARPVEAAVLITDGGQNGGRDPREFASTLAGTTLHIVPIGNTKLQRDVILHHTHAPKAVLIKDTVVVDSIVTAYDCEGETLRLELLENDQVVDQQSLTVTSEVSDQRAQLRWRAGVLGKHTLALRVTPLTNERTEENNTAQVDVLVMEDTIRVLVADNGPRWETRYLINLFKRDERVVFEQLLFEPQHLSNTFPFSVEEWSKYRIIILGDVLPTQFTLKQQEALRDYVREAGGNLILVAGKDAMPAAYADQPLGSLLPVEAGGSTLPANNPNFLHLTDEGTTTLATQLAEDPALNRRLWTEMSEHLPIYWLSQLSKPKPASHSLIWASPSKTSFDPTDPMTRSFLSWHYVGAGRVVYLAAPISYQLRYRQGDTYHHRFWGQLLRWAVARDLGEGSHNVRISTDKSRYDHGEAVEVSVSLRRLNGRPVSGGELRVTATQEADTIQEISLHESASRPGTYHGSLEGLPLGQISLRAIGDPVKELLEEEKYRGAVETAVSIDPSGNLELRHPLCNLPLLRELAQASGGMVVPPTGLPSALDQLHLKPERLETITKKPLWNRWDLFWIFIACLSMEWIGRKLIGLQ